MRRAEKSGTLARDRVARLVEAARRDTLYWDLYIRRAAAHLAPVFSRDLYRLLRRGDAEVAEALRAGDRALNRGDWKEVKEMAVKVRDLQRAQTERVGDMKLGEEVYGLAEIPIDPFSPGFNLLLHSSPDALQNERARLIAALHALGEIDPEWRDFYAGRRAEFEELRLVLEEKATATGRVDPEALRREAMILLERGDVDQLSRIAEEILAAERDARAPASAAAPDRPAPSAPPRRVARTRDTAPRVPEGAVSKASELGLTLEFREPNLEVAEHIRRNAWRPTFPTEQSLTNGGMRVLEGPESLATLREAPRPVNSFEILSKFALHPYVNSGGIRYLPRMDGEWLLVEDFPEDNVPETSALLDALGLPRRRGLSRAAIESALLDRGVDVIEGSLGLDPRAYRLVCVPVDVYTNLGQRRGWGTRPFWTHFDGYQVLPKGGQRALGRRCEVRRSAVSASAAWTSARR
jgi:hypothetical protein